MRTRPKSMKNCLEHQIKQSNQNKIPKKNYIQYLESEKEPPMRIKATQRNLQARLKPKKNIRTPNQQIRTKVIRKFVSPRGTQNFFYPR
jgi:hypothetical protein